MKITSYQPITSHKSLFTFNRALATPNAAVSFQPTELNFRAAPGDIGPDVSSPGGYLNFAGGVTFPNITTGANVRARIEQPGVFSVRDVLLYEWVLEPVDPGELPPGHHGPLPKVKVLEQAGGSDGQTPLAVSVGQYLVVRVEYEAPQGSGTFPGTLIIEGDTWETIRVPLTLSLEEIVTLVPRDTLQIAQGESAGFGIEVMHITGPAIDVSYQLSPLFLDTGLTLAPVKVHLEPSERKPTVLMFTADADAPLGPEQAFIDQFGFTRNSLVIPVEIQPKRQPPPGTVPGKYCEFQDPPGSPSVAPNTYGLKDGRPRKSQIAYSITGTPLNISPSAFAGVIAQAFAKWSAAAPSITANNVGSGGDIVFSVGNLPAGTLGQTTGDGSSITVSSTAAWSTSSPVAPGTSDLLAVVTHEIGHALGLLHATTTNSVMYPFNSNIEILSNDDWSAIRVLYGWAPQNRILGIGTDSGPALCACGGVLVLAWRGIGDDHQIWFSRSTDGINWTPQQSVPGAGTSDGPSLAWDGAQLWMVWKGVPGDQALYYATTNGALVNWSGVTSIGGVGSSCGPSITTVPGVGPLLVWKGVDDDSGIYFTTYQAGSWQPQNNVGGVGTSDRPAVALDVTGIPRMVWKGVEGDHGLYTSTLRGLFWQPQQLVSWVVAGNGGLGTVTVGYPGSEFGPGLITAVGKLFMAWRGVGEDQELWFTQAALGPSFGGQSAAEWSSQAVVGNVASSSRPAVASFNGNVYLAWKGVAGDHAIYSTFV